LSQSQSLELLSHGATLTGEHGIVDFVGLWQESHDTRGEREVGLTGVVLESITRPGRKRGDGGEVELRGGHVVPVGVGGVLGVDSRNPRLVLVVQEVEEGGAQRFPSVAGLGDVEDGGAKLAQLAAMARSTTNRERRQFRQI
jgi:hypothetical protein